MITKKAVIGVGGTLALLAAGFGLATQAHAEPPTPPSAQASADSWQAGSGMMNRRGDGSGTGMQNGGSHGATQNAEYLAEKLGVDSEAVRDALQKFHQENGDQTRGRDLTAEQRAAQHERLAEFLATELGVDKAKVLDALNAQSEDRKAEHTANMQTRLDEAVQAGRLTQEEADAILKAHESGAMGGAMGGGFGAGPRR